MRTTMIALGVGLVLGATINQLFQAEPAAPDCPEVESSNDRELALLRSENKMLVAMVQAGLKGDISAHINAFSQLNQTQTPSKSNSSAVTEETAPKSTTAAPPATAPQLVARLQRADKKLQRQAMEEGWATTDRLVQERRQLWQQVRRQLNDNDYMAALHQTQLPNVLMIDEIRPGSDASKQGVRIGDLLWRLDGVRIFTRSEYNTHLSELPAQTLVSVELRRGQQSHTVVISDVKRSLSVVGDSIPPMQ